MNQQNRNGNLLEIAKEVPISDIYPLPGEEYEIYHEAPYEFQLLRQSIKARGLRVPVSITPRDGGGFYVMDGRRCCYAVLSLGKATIPAIERSSPLPEKLKHARHDAEGMRNPSIPTQRPERSIAELYQECAAKLLRADKAQKKDRQTPTR